jgi:hypothetical protein
MDLKRKTDFYFIPIYHLFINNIHSAFFLKTKSSYSNLPNALLNYDLPRK